MTIPILAICIYFVVGAILIAATYWRKRKTDNIKITLAGCIAALVLWLPVLVNACYYAYVEKRKWKGK